MRKIVGEVAVWAGTFTDLCGGVPKKNIVAFLNAGTRYNVSVTCGTDLGARLCTQVGVAAYATLGCAKQSLHVFEESISWWTLVHTSILRLYRAKYLWPGTSKRTEIKWTISHIGILTGIIARLSCDVSKLTCWTVSLAFHISTVLELQIRTICHALTDYWVFIITAGTRSLTLIVIWVY